MTSSKSEYLTKPFSEAAAAPHQDQLRFLAQLRESPFYRPGTNPSTFRDTAAFCLTLSREEPEDFADRLSIPRSLLDQWIEAQHLPYPALRLGYAKKMIDMALENNDWDAHSLGTPDHGGFKKLIFSH